MGKCFCIPMEGACKFFAWMSIFIHTIYLFRTVLFWGENMFTAADFSIKGLFTKNHEVEEIAITSILFAVVIFTGMIGLIALIGVICKFALAFIEGIDTVRNNSFINKVAMFNSGFVLIFIRQRNHKKMFAFDCLCFWELCIIFIGFIIWLTYLPRGAGFPLSFESMLLILVLYFILFFVATCCHELYQEIEAENSRNRVRNV